MKSRIVYITLGMIVCLAATALANGPKSPKQPGVPKAQANWVKLSDRAQLELLIDEFRTLSQTAINNKLTGTFFKSKTGVQQEAAGQIKDVLRSQKGDQRPSIFINDDSAIIEFNDGDLLIAQKGGQGWKISKSVVADQKSDSKVNTTDQAIHNPERSLLAGKSQIRNLAVTSQQGFSAGQTFIGAAVSSEHGIEKLSRQVTKVNLDREMFGAPEKTASYYQAHYTQAAPFVSASYVQFVVDPAWNRIVYGSLNRWIKSYDQLNGPSAIAVDAAARVFIGETGNQRILVMQLNAAEDNGELEFLFEIPGIISPNDIALDDNGTPLDISDDYLYVADAAANQILKFELDAGSAHQIAAFDRFDSPITVLAGKWNGANNDLLYVIDKVGRRLQLFEEQGGSLRFIKQISGSPGEYFNAIKADHFGNVYVVDNINSRLMKYSADLNFLDAEAGQENFNGLANIDIGFGKITIEGKETFWAGFDQLFTIERWTDGSGAQRRILGASIKDAVFNANADISDISTEFTLTDFADVSARIYDHKNHLIREQSYGWMAPGQKAVFWNRRDNAGKQIAAGEYRMEIAATSPYREEEVSLAAQFYLPLYFWQNSGSDVLADDKFRKQGTPVKWGESPTATAIEDPNNVIYQFTDLNPESDYQVALEFFAGDGEVREQIVFANNSHELIAVTVTGRPQQTGYLQLPKESFSDGTITLSIEKRSGVSAVVSQVWFKETGKGFTVQPASETNGIPTDFVLEDNFPNPFNPSTNIRFQLPQQATVALEVFNVLGQKIRSLVDGNLTAGTHTIPWDGRNEVGAAVSSGIYFYRLTAGEFVESKRMLLIK